MIVSPVRARTLGGGSCEYTTSLPMPSLASAYGTGVKPKASRVSLASLTVRLRTSGTVIETFDELFVSV